MLYYSYRLMCFLVVFLPLAVMKDTASSPLPLSGPYRLGSATVFYRLAASCNYKHFCRTFGKLACDS